MNQIISLLKTSNRVLLTSHENPDGDAIGALIAMGLALESWGKVITLYNESPIPVVYRFLPSVNRIIRVICEMEAYDTAVVLDCSDLERIGRAAEAVKRVPTLINIDHHVTNTRFGDVQLIDDKACATCEIVYRLILDMGIDFDQAIASAIYTGILTDTGSFRFSNTNRAAFSICEKMIQFGVDPYKVAQRVYGTYSLGRIKLLNMALDSIELSDNGKLSMMTLTQGMLDETGTRQEDIEGLINYARRIEDVKVSALIRELSETSNDGNGFRPYHVSLRSNGSVDVSQIANRFGGGGHSTAAGFSIETDLGDLKLKIINIADTL